MIVFRNLDFVTKLCSVTSVFALEVGNFERHTKVRLNIRNDSNHFWNQSDHSQSANDADTGRSQHTAVCSAQHEHAYTTTQFLALGPTDKPL